MLDVFETGAVMHFDSGGIFGLLSVYVDIWMLDTYYDVVLSTDIL